MLFCLWRPTVNCHARSAHTTSVCGVSRKTGTIEGGGHDAGSEASNSYGGGLSPSDNNLIDKRGGWSRPYRVIKPQPYKRLI